MRGLPLEGTATSCAAEIVQLVYRSTSSRKVATIHRSCTSLCWFRIPGRHFGAHPIMYRTPLTALRFCLLLRGRASLAALN